MSNCDDVLDDWEDIDADKLETAFSNLHTYTSSANDNASSLEEEKFANSGNRHSVPTTSATTTIQLLQRSSKHNGITSASTTNTANITVTTTPSNFLVDSGNIPIDSQLMTNNFHPVTMVLHKSDDDYQSANYTASIANQTVKILRRPIQSVEPRNNEVRQKQPLKSLKQREQEYAEARLRIMGVAKNPEDDCASLTACGTQVQPPNSLALSVTNNIAANNVASKTSNTPRNVNNAGTTNPYNNSYSQQQQYQQQLPLHVPQQQQLQQLPSQTQLQQYPQNFHFNPQNYYYAIQHSQSHKSLPAYNNNRTQNMPLLGQAPLPRHNLLGGGASSSAIVGGNGCGPIKAQYPSLMGMTTKYQQQQHQQQQQQHQQQQQQHQQQQQLQLQQSSLHQKILQQQQPIYHQPKLQQQTWSPVVGGKVSYTSIRYQHQQQQQHQQNESVVRSPRGPDGTTGFQIRR